MDRASDSRLQTALGYSFADPRLLRQALTHRGAAATPGDSNERLEFLGDRVLGLLVADLLCQRFPDEDEGALARRFGALVRRDTLARVAQAVGLGDHLILSPGESGSGGRDNPAILSDACEAIIAAIYRDGGLSAATAFVMSHWQVLLDEDLTPPTDAKTALQEWAQGQGLPLPSYREVGRSGPDHAPAFTVEVRVEGLPPAQAEGASKRHAEQQAAAWLLDMTQADGPDS